MPNTPYSRSVGWEPEEQRVKSIDLGPVHGEVSGLLQVPASVYDMPEGEAWCARVAQSRDTTV